MTRVILETLPRIGYAARGVVYILLGSLALTSALWGGGGADGSSEALSSLLGLPFGRIMLALVAVGLLGYVLWKLAQGLLNADNRDKNLQGLAIRAGNLISGGANLVLMFSAASLALNLGQNGGSGRGEEAASAWLLQQPFGPLLLGLIAGGVLTAGGAQFWYGFSHGYRKRMPLPQSKKVWMDPLSAFGLMARGTVFAIIAGFLFYAAFTVSPDQAGGMKEALDYVHALPYGRILYGVMAVGLLAFGLYGILQSRYRCIDLPDLADIRAVAPV